MPDTELCVGFLVLVSVQVVVWRELYNDKGRLAQACVAFFSRRPAQLAALLANARHVQQRHK